MSRRARGAPQFGLCPICKTEDTLGDEHIVSDWLERQMKARLGKLSWSENAEPNTLGHLTMLMCRRCNHRMGVHIEHPVRDTAIPLIFDDRDAELTRKDRKSLARWGLKILIEINYSRWSTIVPDLFIDWLATDGRPEPPDGTTVWIGRFVEDAPPMSSADQERVQPSPYTVAEWGGSFRVIHLAMLAAYRPTHMVRLPAHPAEAMGYLIRVERGPLKIVHWPPQRPMSATTYEAVSNWIIRPDG